METEIKKRKHRKGGTDYAKEKLAKAEAKIKELEKQLNVEVAEHQALEEKYGKMIKDRTEISETIREKAETIRKQATKISELTAEIANLRGTARDYRHKFEEAVRRMGWLRRWWYEYDRPQFTDEDHWHD